MGGQWRLRTSIRGFKNEVLRVSHFPNYSKLRTSTPPNLHFFKEAGSKVQGKPGGQQPADCGGPLLEHHGGGGGVQVSRKLKEKETHMEGQQNDE